MDASHDHDTPRLTGADVIRAELATLPARPGVYRMLDAKRTVLYVGKARNLRKRVASYAREEPHSTRIRQMIARTTTLEITTTHTEVEALLLESNLIKRLKPRYNIVLRDDKSFPYILITGHHRWAQIAKHRGSRQAKGEYFGPFASAKAVNETLTALQRAFPLRSCSDTVLESRTRPCLQYQIKRCAAPCVGHVDMADYEAIVDDAREFLAGRSHVIQTRLSRRMVAASEALDYETASIYRDRIRALTQIQARQGINLPNIDQADIVVAHQEAGQTCVQVFFFRGGRSYGNRAYYPSHAGDADGAEVLDAFLGQFYANKEPPKLVLLSHAVARHDILEQALAVRAGRRVRLTHPQRGDKRLLVERALSNAREALGRRLAESASQRRLLEGVGEAFGLYGPPRRIEVYDNSHVQGQHAVGGMIVAGPEGLLKGAYRRFTIKKAMAPGDDYAMMREVLGRRFRRLLHEDAERTSAQWPDLVLVDGGAGQLSAAVEVFADLGVTRVALAAISKGPNRNAGRESFHAPGRATFQLGERDPVLYFLQRLRDEAHRFAITAHRGQRSRAITRSLLDDVPGIGGKRKKALLHHFGSAAAVARAGLADLESVSGISGGLASVIYGHFHTSD